MPEILTQENPPDDLRRQFELIMDNYLDVEGNADAKGVVTRCFKTIIAILRRHLSQRGNSNLELDYGMGIGRMAKVPWITVRDKRISKSTRQGVYCVYLFKADMSGVCLTVNQGVGLGVDKGPSRKDLETLQARAIELRPSFATLQSAGFSLDNYLDLKDPRGTGRSYEMSAIAYKCYEGISMPEDKQLVLDLQSALTPYEAFAERVLNLRQEDPRAEPETEVEIEDAHEQDSIEELSLSFEQILHAFSSQNLYFEPDLFANYLLALQTKRFVILTGISGTGKTRLARALAGLLNDTTSQEDAATSHYYRVIPVRPDWTDNRGLLGYFNPITQKYVMTPFLRLLLDAQIEFEAAQIRQDKPGTFFAVLDEMNLARVEYYFSDFLSAMESEESISLYDKSSLENNGDRDQDVPFEVKVPKNIFFVGTVNIDETTYMFSPKVLDRAFTIELNDVDLEALGTKNVGHTKSSPLFLIHFPGELRFERLPTANDWRDFAKLLGGSLRQVVISLNEILGRENKHFGYRSANEIARFVNLAAGQAAGTEDSIWAALDLAILEKALPKLNGTQQELEGVLSALFNFVISLQTNDVWEKGVVLEDWELSFGRLRPLVPGGEEEGPSIRLPRTAAKLWRMLKRLRQQGFTSYIE